MTFAEELAAATAKIDALLVAPPAPAPSEDGMVKMTAADALVKISAELASTTVTKERAEYLKTVLGELSKNFEATSFISIKEIKDPTQLLPKTESIGTIQSLAAAAPDSGFASNMTGVQKAQLIQKLLTDKAELKKSAVTEKLDAIKSMFGLTDADLKDTYDLRWKIGDLIGLVQDAVKLEQLIGEPSEPTPAKKAADAAWPRDMAGAKFDPVTKAYEPSKSAWDD